MKRKILTIIPIIIFFVSVFVGFVKINMINSSNYSDRNHLDQGLEKELGIKVSDFIEDDSKISIKKDEDEKIIVEIYGNSYEFNGDIIGNLEKKINKDN